MAKIKTSFDEQQKINDYYKSKYEFYQKMSLEDLKKLYEDNQKSKKTRLGGTHRRAFMDVVSKKLQEESVKTAIEDSKIINDNNIEDAIIIDEEEK